MYITASCTSTASNTRSSRVRDVHTDSREVEYTTLSSPRHCSANSTSTGDVPGASLTVSQTAIVSYIFRP